MDCMAPIARMSDPVEVGIDNKGGRAGILPARKAVNDVCAIGQSRGDGVVDGDVVNLRGHATLFDRSSAGGSIISCGIEASMVTSPRWA